MSESQQHLLEVEGCTLSVEEHGGRGASAGVVIAGHAMMCNRRTLDRPARSGLASTLCAKGLKVYSFDARGHGASGKPASKGGRWTYDLLVDDLSEIVRWVRARHPDAPLAFFGHSLLGHAMLAWLGQNPGAPIGAAVVYASNVWLRGFEPSNARWLKKRAVLEAWLAISRLRGYFPARSLRLGSDDESVGLVADMARWARSGRCLRERDGADYVQGLRTIRIPVLAYTGERDTLLCAAECCEQYLAGLPECELRVVPGAEHMTLVREEFRHVWLESADWLAERLSAQALPSMAHR